MAFLLHALRPDDCFIDVGANVGSYTVLASSAIGARTICFEPVPSTYQRLKANIRLNAMEGRVSAYNCGLGESETTIQFSTDQNCMNHVIASTEEVSASVDVKVKSLDSTLSESPFLIKIDVEGYELPVLRGAKNTLRDECLNAVILELNSSGARYGFEDQEIVDLLMEYGFRAYQYQPFERSLNLIDGKNQTSGNTLFLRDFELVNDRIKNANNVRIHGCEF